MSFPGEGGAKGHYLQYPEVRHILEVRLKDNSQVIGLEIPETRTELTSVSCCLKSTINTLNNK
jgi:hypothetical protein